MIGRLFDRIRHTVFGAGPPVVAVLRLTGPIGATARFRPGLNLANTARQIEQAFTMGGVKAVAIAVNSPGGSPVQSALIMKRIRDFAREKDIPVLAFAEDVAASGGYMLALAGDEIYAHEASIIGSIGVVAGGFGFAQAIEKLGVERRLYAVGEHKARLDPFSPEKKEDVDWLHDLQEDIHEYFKSVVRDRRGKRLKSPRADIFSGDVWLAEQAKKYGLIDGIGDLRGILRERFGKKVKLRLVSEKKGLLSGLFRTRESDEEGGHALADLPAALIATIEARLMWNRFGL